MSAEKAGAIILSIVSFIVALIVGLLWLYEHDTAVGIIGVTYCLIAMFFVSLMTDNE